MIHYGKTLAGDLQVVIPADEAGEIHELIQSAGLLQRRTFNGMRQYIEKEFAGELEQHRRRMGKS